MSKGPHDEPVNWRTKQYKVPFGRYSSGLIDDVRIYDVALSAEEIKELVR